MGRYINPGNSGFAEILNSTYVDKTSIIGIINQSINTTNKLTCVSRPRRFGKSYAAKTVSAYYDCSVDSHELYDRLRISQSSDYSVHINKYYVIQLDITSFIKNNKDNDIVNRINDALVTDIKAQYPQYKDIEDLFDILFRLVNDTKRKIVVVIDEWDAIIREYNKHPDIQQSYLNFLRRFFKDNTFTPNCVAAAYMTGILPIKKTKSESAISDFKEYTVLKPGKFAGFIGFNEIEVKALCEKHNLNFVQMKYWYDGYSFGKVADIYNPYSVMSVIESEEYGSYWKKTSAAESLQNYVDMDYEGLQGDIEKLIKGAEIIVDTDNFKNDFANFSTKDDILTLLIHLGYLTYDSENRLARIPNEELRSEFRSMLKTVRSPELIRLMGKAKLILEKTLAYDEEYVAKAFDELCETNYAPTFYNNEQSLRSMIRLAYLAAVDRYINVEELPSGKGLADVVYIPQKYAPEPALIVELKWDKTAESALQQIKDKKYPSVLKGFGGDALLIGINYDMYDKIHTCKIDRIHL